MIGTLALLYLAIALATVGACCMSSRRIPLTMASLNLVFWVLANLLKIKLPAVMGLDPLSFLDAFACSGCALVGLAVGRRWSLVVALAFACQIIAHAAFALDARYSEYEYRSTLNGFFMLQEAAIAWGALIAKPPPRGQSI